MFIFTYTHVHKCIYPMPFLSSFFANKIMKLNVMDEGRTDTDSVKESIQVISFCGSFLIQFQRGSLSRLNWLISPNRGDSFPHLVSEIIDHSYKKDGHFELIPSDANPTPLIVAPSLVRERGVVVVYIYLHTCIYPTPFLSSFFANEIMKLNVMDEGRTDTDSVTESIQVISFCDTGGGDVGSSKFLPQLTSVGNNLGSPVHCGRCFRLELVLDLRRHLGRVTRGLHMVVIFDGDHFHPDPPC